MRAFVDTNVLLDVIVRREPFYETAALIWALAETGRIDAHVAAISFNNVFYIVNRLANKKSATEAVKCVRSVFQIVSVDSRIIDAAIESGMDDFEDAIQYQCALRCKARYLITRNPQDFPRIGMVVKPEVFLSLIK
ncbi:MAG: PIN domain-containing protein [Candidatus Hydrogenedentes bacterium]|nr:PIN domain-containing protein [Candidatus Hydrogenedentota bacterium]